jgi:phosphohistidine swiveling domain-containing protein
MADPRRRAVAHLHPPAVVAADLAGITIRPIYERTVLIRNGLLGEEMVAAMRSRPVVICRGHGITSAAATVQQTVLQDLPDLGPGFTVDAAWRHELARIDSQPR